MFASSFRFLRQLGSKATAPTSESPGTETRAAVVPVADAAPQDWHSVAIDEIFPCAHVSHVLFSVSRGATVKPYFYVECEGHFFGAGAPIVIPSEGGIIEVNALSPHCFLQVVTVPGGDTSPVRICAATVSRYGK